MSQLLTSIQISARPQVMALKDVAKAEPPVPDKFPIDSTAIASGIVDLLLDNMAVVFREEAAIRRGTRATTVKSLSQAGNNTSNQFQSSTCNWPTGVFKSFDNTFEETTAPIKERWQQTKMGNLFKHPPVPVGEGSEFLSEVGMSSRHRKKGHHNKSKTHKTSHHI